MQSTCSERILELRSLADTVKSAFREHFTSISSYVHETIVPKQEPMETRDCEVQASTSTDQHVLPVSIFVSDAKEIGALGPYYSHKIPPV